MCFSQTKKNNKNESKFHDIRGKRNLEFVVSHTALKEGTNSMYQMCHGLTIGGQLYCFTKYWILLSIAIKSILKKN